MSATMVRSRRSAPAHVAERVPGEVREFLRASAYHPVRLAALGSGLVLMLTAMLCLSPGVEVAPNFLDLMAVVCSAFATACGVVAMRRAAPEARTTWWCFTWFAGLWLVGHAAYAVMSSLAPVVPDISPADFFYVVGVVPALLALLRFPVPTLERGANSRIVLDGVVLASALLTSSYVIALDEVFGDFEVGAEGLLYSFYPISDLLMAGMAGLLILRSSGGVRPDLALFCLGFLVYAATDTGYAFAGASGERFGVMVGLGYVAAPLVLGLAALSSSATSMQATTLRRVAPSRLAALVPDLAGVTALLIFVLVGVDGWVSTALAVATILATSVRQYILVSDNLDLRRELERRVADRTAALQRLAERYQRILDSVGEGIIGVDRRGRISFLNPAAEQLLGAEGSDLVGRHACHPLVEGAGDDHDCPVEEVTRTGETVRRTGVTFARTDGTTFPVDLTITAKYRGGRTDGVVMVFRDVSEQEAIERMKREFVVAVSHELRTPLTAMHGSLEMLADGVMGELPAAAKSAIELAMRGSARLTRLVGDILDAERLAAGTMPLALGARSVQSMLEAAARPMMVLASEAGMSVEVQPCRAWVKADSDRIVQALTNLLGNAIKFSSMGTTVVVGARVVGREVVLSVADRGRGIPERDLGAIFERFHQVDVTDSLGGGGTGLGLAITRAIVEQHGGRIWVDSEVGVGSVFSFTLPRCEVPRSAPARGVLGTTRSLSRRPL